MDEPLGSNCLEASDGLMTVGDFVLLHRLGEGSYGSVFQGLHKRTKKVYAIKQVYLGELGDQDLKRIRHEAQMMQGLHHSNVTQFYQILHTTSAYYFVMELAEGGELFDKIISVNSFSEATARKYFQQLISAIHYCHDQGITHGDLKAENLLLDREGRLKVCDFGLSRSRFEEEDDAGLGGMVGTTNYMSPELFEAIQAGLNGEDGGPAKNPADGFRADLYASGVILYFMVTGSLPFGANGEGEEEVEYNIKNAFYDESMLTRSQATLVQGLLEPDPKKRYTLTDILNDPWFLVNVKCDMFPTGRVKHLEGSGNQRSFLDFKKRDSTASSVADGGGSGGGFAAIRGPGTPIPTSNTSAEENEAENEEEDDAVTEEEEAVLRAAFDKIDVDHNGDRITKDELRDCLINLTKGSVSISQDDLNALTEHFHPADKEGGNITFDEFKSAWTTRDLAHAVSKFTDVFQLQSISKIGNQYCPAEHSIMKELRGAFDTLDEAHIGLIDHRNLVQVFDKAGVTITEHEASSLIHAMGTIHHNNQVSFDEFVNSIAHEDILVKHPVGRRLASAANLLKFAGRQEFEELVSHGMTVQGQVEDTLQKISSHAQLVHLGHCEAGVCTTAPTYILGPGAKGSEDNGGPVFGSSGPMAPLPPASMGSPTSVSPVAVEPPILAANSGSPLVGPCPLGGAGVANLHTFQYNPSGIGRLEGGVNGTTTSGNTPRMGGNTPKLTPRSMRGVSPGHTPVDTGLPARSNSNAAHGGVDTGLLAAANVSQPWTNAASYGGGVSHGAETPNTPQRRHNNPCTVDVKLRGAACHGYTTVRVTRITGSTLDFHEVVKHIGLQLQQARDQALEDSSPIDDGELM